MARQYQKKQHLLKQIKEMLESGMTQREIADELGLTGYLPVHELLKRDRKNRSGAADAAPLRLKLNISYMGAFCTVRINWGSPIFREGIFSLKQRDIICACP